MAVRPSSTVATSMAVTKAPACARSRPRSVECSSANARTSTTVARAAAVRHRRQRDRSVSPSDDSERPVTAARTVAPTCSEQRCGWEWDLPCRSRPTLPGWVLPQERQLVAGLIVAGTERQRTGSTGSGLWRWPGEHGQLQFAVGVRVLLDSSCWYSLLACRLANSISGDFHGPRVPYSLDIGWCVRWSALRAR